MKKGGGVHQRQNWYTYLLIDPCDWSVFYVGKGTGKRIDAHVAAARRGDHECNPRKFARIKDIMDRGRSVMTVIFSRHIEEGEAFDCEDLLIESLAGENLTNILGSRAMQRREKCDLILARMKPFYSWFTESDMDHGEARECYDRFVAELRAEGLRTGGNTHSSYVPKFSVLTHGPVIERWERNADGELHRRI